VSDSSASLYSGNFFSVFIEMEAGAASQPRPNRPFPLPELYPREMPGIKPFREGEKGKGMLKPAVPLAAFTWNLSSMDLIAPPPLGRLIWGM